MLVSSENEEFLIFAVFDGLCIEGLYRPTHELVNSSELVFYVNICNFIHHKG